MKEMNIELPEGFEMDNFEVVDKVIKVKLKEKDELPSRWEDVKRIDGCFISSGSFIHDVVNEIPSGSKRNTWPSKEEAEAALALSQLCQLRDVYNDGWKPYWRNDTIKHVIYIADNGIHVGIVTLVSNVLAFKSEELRDKFLTNFKDLIEVAKPLL